MGIDDQAIGVLERAQCRAKCRAQCRGLTRRWLPRSAAQGGELDPHHAHDAIDAHDPRGPGAPARSLVDRVLAVRGLAGDEARAFLNPTLMGLHEPSAMAGIDDAARRLLEALRAREPIVIYGDYDVDGITASAILYRMLRAIEPGAAVSTYVPHRLEEGYGLNAAALVSLAQGGARVVVTVDCGVTALGPAAQARLAGLDLIITDHHNPPGEGEAWPQAAAIVHPRAPRPDGGVYPFADLCGAGVAYKLAWRLAALASGGGRANAPLRELLVELLALAALGTVADVVPLHGENRSIVHHGLRRCRSSPFIGLGALVRASGLDGERIGADDVGFKLGPRLNACGRMGSAAEAVELLITDDPARADEIAAGLTRQNNQRRVTEKRILEQALELAQAHGMTGPSRRAVVLAHPDWHPGVVGIVCSRLTEALGRPAILMQAQPPPDAQADTPTDSQADAPGRGGDGVGLCVGSGRSVEGFNLHAALRACSAHLTKFGGHDAAAGLALPADRLPAFTEAFIDLANRAIAEEDLLALARYDVAASPDEFTLAAVSDLLRLAPFGRGNPRVCVRLEGVRLAAAPRPLGSTGRHVELRLESADAPGGRVLRVLGWDWAKRLDGLGLRAGVAVGALVEPAVSEWNGQKRCEGVLVDLRIEA